MNVVFEIADSAVERFGYKFYSLYDIDKIDQLKIKHRSMLLFSDRVWIEDSTGVRFFKNRFTGLLGPVDTKEFVWIKLKCRNI